MIRTIESALLLSFALLICGCGGGSEGTGPLGGSQRTVMGSVSQDNGAAVAKAVITDLASGNTTQTDQTGAFSILVSVEQGPVTLQVDSGNTSRTVSIGDVSSEAPALQVNINLSADNASQQTDNISIWARVVGACDQFFENKEVIRQSNPVNGETSCTLKFFASGNGKRLERVPATIEVRACNQRRWRPIAFGQTGVGLEAGVGQIEFTFIDNQRNCEYRLGAPHEVAGTKELYVYIATATLQSQ